MMDLDEAIRHAEEVMVENLEKTKGRNASDPIAINCFECADEHRQLAEWLKELKAYKENTCSDVISRQAVMDCFKKWQPYMATRLWDFEQELSALPSVTPQQRTGRWGKEGECPFCGYFRQWVDDNFCGNCGAKMEVEE